MQVFIIVIVILVVLIAAYLILPVKNNSENAINDAKRLAKLLVAEIKLYQTYKVEKGLKNNNLSETLCDEIEQARKKYQKRFFGAEFENYFDAALVEILADGDRSKFGSNSPVK